MVSARWRIGAGDEPADAERQHEGDPARAEEDQRGRPARHAEALPQLLEVAADEDDADPGCRRPRWAATARRDRSRRCVSRDRGPRGPGERAACSPPARCPRPRDGTERTARPAACRSPATTTARWCRRLESVRVAAAGSLKLSDAEAASPSVRASVERWPRVWSGRRGSCSRSTTARTSRSTPPVIRGHREGEPALDRRGATPGPGAGRGRGCPRRRPRWPRLLRSRTLPHQGSGLSRFRARNEVGGACREEGIPRSYGRCSSFPGPAVPKADTLPAPVITRPTASAWAAATSAVIQRRAPLRRCAACSTPSCPRPGRVAEPPQGPRRLSREAAQEPRHRLGIAAQLHGESLAVQGRSLRGCCGLPSLRPPGSSRRTRPSAPRQATPA